MPIQRSKLLGYAVATFTVAAATLLTLPLPFVRERSPYLTFFAAVAVTAWYGGLGPGLVAVALSAASLAYFFLPPDFSLVIVLEDALPLAGFTLVAVLISSLHAAHRRAERALLRERAELQHSNADLKQTQAQLVQAAKLAALGELVAGVAHEINNPLAYLANDNASLHRDIPDMCELLTLYECADATIARHEPELHRQIRERADSMDLTYTLANLEKVLERSHAGLKRIQQIVQDLRGFARINDRVWEESVDLNAGIESTLNIVRGRAQQLKVELITDLAPLPRMTCSLGKINQVVLNLVANAIDACAGSGKVVVRTRCDNAGVEIHVIDTGHGIEPAIRNRIFDPFFTTKPPGQGTGLGLSISYGIVQEHGGCIEVDSAPGQGAHFVVRLPLKRKTTEHSGLARASAASIPTLRDTQAAESFSDPGNLCAPTRCEESRRICTS